MNTLPGADRLSTIGITVAAQLKSTSYFIHYLQHIDSTKEFYAEIQSRVFERPLASKICPMQTPEIYISSHAKLLSNPVSPMK